MQDQDTVLLILFSFHHAIMLLLLAYLMCKDPE